jgi:hypothetical protein
VITDRTHALEVRRLKFLVKVYLACRLSTGRSLALKVLKKPGGLKYWPQLCRPFVRTITIG